MDDLPTGILGAFVAGILVSVSPCPMATNIAAISYIGRRVDRPRLVLLSGLLYTLGRSLTYMVLACILASSLMAGLELSDVLQRCMNLLLGPILILLAMFLLGLLTFGFGGGGVSEKMQKRIDGMGVWGAGLLGILFALAFCPATAAFFFGMVGKAASSGSRILHPTVFGIGSALPVAAFAALIAYSAESVGKAYNVLTQVSWWVQRAAGVIFLAVGIHLSLVYILEIKPFWSPWLKWLSGSGA